MNIFIVIVVVAKFHCMVWRTRTAVMPMKISRIPIVGFLWMFFTFFIVVVVHFMCAILFHGQTLNCVAKRYKIYFHKYTLP